MKLLVQGDDYGFTKGVTLGMLEGIDHGVLTCSGLFAQYAGCGMGGRADARRPDFCWGIDFNLVTGPCCADPRQIPHFVDAAGNFIRSGITVRTRAGRAKLVGARCFRLKNVIWKSVPSLTAM